MVACKNGLCGQISVAYMMPFWGMAKIFELPNPVMQCVRNVLIVAKIYNYIIIHMDTSLQSTAQLWTRSRARKIFKTNYFQSESESKSKLVEPPYDLQDKYGV